MAPSAALAQDETLTDANAWAIEQVQAPAAWESTRGEGITVAVMDSGIARHPFFEDKDVLPGRSVFTGEEDAWNDANGHGTHVAAGVLYVAPEATILPVRMDTNADVEFGGALGDAEYADIRWAVDNGADILVMPWGITGEGSDEELRESLQYVIDKGAVIVAAAGNNPNIDVTHPASIEGVVAVSGTDTNGNAWFGNTTGPEVVVAAPADEMTHPKPQVTVLGESELYESGIGGTSVGSGIVGGVAALTWAANPDLDASNVINRLVQTAGDGSGSNRTEVMGFGLVNADRAVHADGIEAVDENPLGYPMGEAGASGASPEGDGEDATEAADAEPSPAEGSKTAAEAPESGLSAIIVIAAAVVLIGAAITVWLVLRGRSRKQGPPGSGQTGAFGPEGGPAYGGFSQPGPSQPHSGPSTSTPQGYGGPPSGHHQPYGPSAGAGEPNPPWGPGHVDERR
ncbi:S8 family serine peptidase [Glycomyces sp. L485]|uniref:S8 family serine peptidase n=1 Tax=Glycomyces sp. L485 TaxID=2909235 RepID=UPI001F4A388C|nr:S8 family serine peptidase [Glycomyces sp. L485]MCH7232596.1 S8 family serine peptidase [Glycomyces sp. L485]